MLPMQCNAHCVLLGPKYALKKTYLFCDAYPVDESYASQWQKIMVFLPRDVEGKAKKLQRHLWAVPTWYQ